MSIAGLYGHMTINCNRVKCSTTLYQVTRRATFNTLESSSTHSFVHNPYTTINTKEAFHQYCLFRMNKKNPREVSTSVLHA